MSSMMAQPLQLKKQKPSNLLKKQMNNMITDEVLSEVDEEEEKKIANAFTEVKQGTVYRER